MCVFWPKFLREKEGYTLYVGSTNSVSYVNVFNSLCLCVKSVTLESNNDIHMQNNTLEYDNRLCF